MHPVSLRKRRFEDLFRTHDVRTVVHLSVVSSPRIDVEARYNHNVRGTRQVLKHCLTHGVRRFVLLSRGSVYGAAPLNPVYLDEESPLDASRHYAGMRDIIEVDHLTQSFTARAPELSGVILRPVYVVGPSVHNTISTYLRLRLVPTVLGYDPMMQLMHEEDVVEALQLAIKVPGAQGIYNICGPGALPLSVIVRESGGSRLPIPKALFYRLLKTLWRMNMAPAPVPEVDFIRYACILDDSRARTELSYQPQFTLTELVRSIRHAPPKVILD